MTDPHGKMDKIRKLLAQAESAAKIGHEDEARTFTAKASELIAQYGIDEALINVGAEVKAKVISRDFWIDGSYQTDKTVLLSNLSSVLRSKAIRLRGMETGQRTLVRVFGFAADLERLDVLYTSLLTQATYGVLSARPEYGSTTSYRKSFFAAFTSVVSSRVAAIESAAESAAGTSTALVLYDRTKEVTDAFKTEFPQTRTSYRKLRAHANGKRDGAAAGQRADLGQSRMGSTPSQRRLG